MAYSAFLRGDNFNHPTTESLIIEVFAPKQNECLKVTQYSASDLTSNITSITLSVGALGAEVPLDFVAPSAAGTRLIGTGTEIYVKHGQRLILTLVGVQASDNIIYGFNGILFDIRDFLQVPIAQ